LLGVARMTLRSLLLIGALAAAGCAGDALPFPESTGNGAGSNGGSISGGSNGSSVGGGAPDLAVAANPDLTETPSPPSIVCGGLAGRPCPDGMFCQTKPGECCCDFEGTCVAFPTFCPSTADDRLPVCGCDGKTYDDPCHAEQAGVSIDFANACDASFVCGATTCDIKHACTQTCSGIGEPPPPTCTAPPPGCIGVPTCACVPTGPFLKCSDVPGGGIFVEETGCE
jgi:hypothetical protein